MTESQLVQCRYPNALELSAKQQMQQALTQLRSDMLLSQPFVAVLAMRLKMVVVVDDRLPTACTDSQHIFFNLDFMSKCSTAQQRFILAHEVWHCVMGHFLRQQQRDPLRWNFACDYEVNGILSYFFTSNDMPRNVLFEHDYLGKSAEQIYTLLGKLPETKWVDTYRWEGSRLPVENPQFDQHQPDLTLLDQETIRIDPDFRPQKASEVDVERWREYTAAAGQVTGLTAGSFGGELQRIVNNALKPQLHWPTLLQRFIQRTICGSYQWHKPARRYLAQGLYLPGRQGQSLQLTLAIDTSGSTLDDLPQFLAELSAILQDFEQVRLQVISCDSRVTDVSFYEKADLAKLKQWQAKGLGGTSFTPVFQYIANDPDQCTAPNALIFFTDGYGNAPAEAPAYPVIWVLSQQGQAPVNWGEVLYLQ